MQFSTSISIDLNRTDWQRIDVTDVNRVWLPKKVIFGDGVFTNPLDAIVQLKFNSMNGDAHPWAIADGCMNSISGRVLTVFAKVLTKGDDDNAYLVLSTGNGVAAGYGNTDGLSPFVGAGGGGGGLEDFSHARGGDLDEG